MGERAPKFDEEVVFGFGGVPITGVVRGAYLDFEGNQYLIILTPGTKQFHIRPMSGVSVRRGGLE